MVMCCSMSRLDIFILYAQYDITYYKHSDHKWKARILSIYEKTLKLIVKFCERAVNLTVV